MSDALDAIRQVDGAGQLDDVLGLPEHLRDALWRVESAGLEGFEARSLLVCGMGGSAIGGDLARAALGDRVCMPMATVRGYEIPSWTPTDAAVLCSSYSGDTEEALACFAAAEALGAPRVVATTGGALAEAAREAGVKVIGMPSGMQPRAAVGYTFVAAAEVAAIVGVAPGIRTEIDSSAAHLDGAVASLAQRSAAIAAELEGTVPVIYGCDLTRPVAYRWKTEVNENAKAHAFSHELPEMDHNEIVGWEGAPDGLPMSAVFLQDSDQHPREARRFELTAELLGPHAKSVVRVQTEGETRTERLLWAVMLGDLVSLQLAAQRGMDPTPVEVLGRFKDALGRP